LNRAGELLIGCRNDSRAPHWQFPQGGMKDGETPEDAILRELREEIGTSHVRILGILPRRTRYVWAGELPKGVFDGQSHIWFIVRLEGELEEHQSSEEFSGFAWIRPEDALERTHPVRRATYQEVHGMFLEWLQRHADGVQHH
jgi:putative (di)nucleoside polyphosphate hydrolase